MSINKLAIGAAMLLLSVAAQADGINNPKSGGSGGGWVGFDQGPNNLGVGGNGAPVTPCLAGQLDFSVATGCNTTWYMTVMH